MRLIFIRHGEPDYETDSLTAQGRKEAAALAKRVGKWTDIDGIYVSPMGRAKETAEPSLRALHREAKELDWIHEFSPRIVDPTTKREHCVWDLMPQDYTADPLMMDPDRWFEGALYRAYPEVERECKRIWQGIDGILEENGYFRHPEENRPSAYYDFRDPTGHVNRAGIDDVMIHGTHEYERRDRDDDKNLVFFCHFGVTSVILGRLLHVSPVALWHDTCIPPTGVTVVNAEKRLHNTAHFRIQALGDTAHLYAAGVHVSGYAAFSTVFQG